MDRRLGGHDAALGGLPGLRLGRGVLQVPLDDVHAGDRHLVALGMDGDDLTDHAFVLARDHLDAVALADVQLVLCVLFLTVMGLKSPLVRAR